MFDIKYCGQGKQFENLDNDDYTSLIGTYSYSIEQPKKSAKL